MSKCKYCGSTSFGSSCAYSPNGMHKHETGIGKCVYCGHNPHGQGCAFSPSGRHMH